jgi:nitrogenase molybdenum-iron protein NifN
MNEATTVMGGFENVEKAILNIRERAKPDLIAICSTGLTETKGDDVSGYLKLVRQRHPEAEDTALVYASTPDYTGAFQDGWSAAVSAMIRELAKPAAEKKAKQVNILPGCHLTPADIEEVREMIESFGLTPLFLPDLSRSLDGHMSDEFSPTTMGGTTLAEAADMGASAITLAIGEHMRSCAETLQEVAGVPYVVFDRLLGLEASDKFIAELARISGQPVPYKWRRLRSQLQDAMLDAQFFTGGKKVAIGAEPDLLWSLGSLLNEMGCEIACAVTTTHSPLLERIPCAEVIIGDLEDLERGAKDCDLLVTHSHGRQAAEHLHISHFRAGLPMFDRLGAGHKLMVGYRGTRDTLFEVGNMFLADLHHHEGKPDSWPLPQATLDAVAAAVALSH